MQEKLEFGVKAGTNAMLDKLCRSTGKSPSTLLRSWLEEQMLVTSTNLYEQEIALQKASQGQAVTKIYYVAAQEDMAKLQEIQSIVEQAGYGKKSLSDTLHGIMQSGSAIAVSDNIELTLRGYREGLRRRKEANQ